MNIRVRAGGLDPHRVHRVTDSAVHTEHKHDKYTQLQSLLLCSSQFHIARLHIIGEHSYRSVMLSCCHNDEGPGHLDLLSESFQGQRPDNAYDSHADVCIACTRCIEQIARDR